MACGHARRRARPARARSAIVGHSSPCRARGSRAGKRSAGHARASAPAQRGAVRREQSEPPKGRLAQAERAGFEPARHLSAPTRFPVALLRPLGHLSEDAQPTADDVQRRARPARARPADAGHRAHAGPEVPEQKSTAPGTRAPARLPSAKRCKGNRASRRRRHAQANTVALLRPLGHLSEDAQPTADDAGPRPTAQSGRRRRQPGAAGRAAARLRPARRGRSGSSPARPRAARRARGG